MDPKAFRKVMGSFPTGVTVVSARDASGEPRGLTVNAFTSVSLDPPLVLVCLDHGSSTHDLLLEAETFAVSMLSVDQKGVALRCATEPSATRFRDIVWWEGPGGRPIVTGCAAWLACRIHAVHPGGDHSIVVGLVEEIGQGDDEPLAFFRGSFGTVAR